jgi:GT2 family glycosyltransferase
VARVRYRPVTTNPEDRRLTVAIPTCGRPRAIEACLASLSILTIAHHVVVLDSLITDETRGIYARYPELELIAFDQPRGPAEARHLLAKACLTPFLLFLDDDNLVLPGGTERLLAHLDANPSVDIAAGGWIEDGATNRRAIGQWIHEGRQGGRTVSHKTFLTIAQAKELGLSSVRVDVPLATMVARREVFDRVSFDPRFAFFFEFWDFGLQCQRERIVIEVLPDVLFEHRPIPYAETTLRQTRDPEEDARRLAGKWDRLPVGPRGFRAQEAGVPTTTPTTNPVTTNRIRRFLGRGP